ncbi:MAG: hypothetical protein DHS20C01_20490 [marine bacterium B5-7]|nr:MAG: hypothetical protein DHS20C01_20490 [marine bacterium B5-7]
MKVRLAVSLVTCFGLTSLTHVYASFAGPIDELLNDYIQQGAGPFVANAGRDFWYEDFNGKSCTGCHADRPVNQGRHVRTGKLIAPMAPSMNVDRFTDKAHVAKWLLRNCKWTLGRECNAQEKGDLLSWLRQQ